jgi:PHD/YefM family antitoxin component YafN of YafNO toxin-antitoxin module
MPKVTERYLVDRRGKPAAVLLDIKSYRRLLQRLEDLEDALELDRARRAAKGFRSYAEIRKELVEAGRL